MAEANLEFKGLTEFQKDLLAVAQVKLPKESFKAMRRIGNRATTHVRRKSRALVKKKTGNYHKAFKRGKVWKAKGDKIIVRVLNTSPHGHLIEYGHRQVTKDGQEVGFTQGKHVMEYGIKDFDNSGDFERMLGEWLDKMLVEGKL